MKETKSESVKIRVRPSVLEEWKKRADADGKSLSEWIERCCALEGRWDKLPPLVSGVPFVQKKTFVADYVDQPLVVRQVSPMEPKIRPIKTKPPQTFEVIRGEGASKLLECAKTPPAPSKQLIDSASKPYERKHLPGCPCALCRK